MLKLDPRILTGLQACKTAKELEFYLQNAVELEHATIPTYLTAMFSLIPGRNDAIAKRIRGVVIEEMLHMSISANILVAIGGHPQINTEAFIPRYPGGLPMGIGSDDLEVPIAPFSMDLIKDVFMKIEEPEEPIEVKTLLRAGAAKQPEFATIGEFYQAVKAKISELGDGIFSVGPERQMLSWFDQERLFPIVDVESANRAIDIIVTEGEGSSTSPFDSPGDPAHYYTFGEILAGRELIKTSTGFAYGGADIPFDPDGVYPARENAKLEDYPVGSIARVLAERYAYSYSSLLNALHESFNGTPETINAAIGLMYEVSLQAQKMMSTPIAEGGEQTVGPVYVKINSESGLPPTGI